LSLYYVLKYVGETALSGLLRFWAASLFGKARAFDYFLLYYFGEVVFSDFADEPAENASRVACLACFDEAELP
jgi:hypothetical protein